MLLVVGYGMIGSVIANEMSATDEVVVLDKRKVENSQLNVLTGDISDYEDLVDKADAVICALPGNVAYGVVSRLLKKGKKVVDVSFMPENSMDLNELAKSNNGLLIPDAGYAPGLTNIISGYFYKKYKPRSIEIYDGGLPRTKVPPMDYTVTWSVKGLIDLYTRPARLIRDNKLTTVDPLGDIEKVNFPEIGELESFFVDGLGTLLYTLKGVDMFEKTYRYPGHLEKIKFLREMGYFSEDEISGCSPRSISESLFENKLKMNVEDFSILEVKALGEVEKEARCIAYYDKERKITSMARLTGFSAVAVAELLLNDDINETGVYPPEYLGFEEETFNKIINSLRKRGLDITLK